MSGFDVIFIAILCIGMMMCDVLEQVEEERHEQRR